MMIRSSLKKNFFWGKLYLLFQTGFMIILVLTRFLGKDLSGQFRPFWPKFFPVRNNIFWSCCNLLDSWHHGQIIFAHVTFAWLLGFQRIFWPDFESILSYHKMAGLQCALAHYTNSRSIGHTCSNNARPTSGQTASCQDLPRTAAFSVNY